MRRKRRISNSIDKAREISNSLVASYISAGLFGFWALFAIPSLFVEFTVYSAFVAVFVAGIAVQSVSILIALNKLSKSFEENPSNYERTPVPKPIMYRAIFWYLPK